MSNATFYLSGATILLTKDRSFGNQYELMLFLTKGRHLLRGKRRSNIWQFPRVPAKQLLHPAQKPVPLLARAIGASSDYGNLVVDPYAGSGSTGEACKMTGRRFLLGDIDQRKVKTASLRLGIPCNLEDEHVAPAHEPSRLEVPSLETYSIHPEQLAEVLHLMKENTEQGFGLLTLTEDE